MIKNIKDNIKLFLPLTILILMFIFQTLNTINNQYYNEKNLKISQNKLFLAIKLADVLHETQKERGMAVGFVSSKGKKFKDQLKSQQLVTDKAIKRFYSSATDNDKMDKCVEKILQLKKLRLDVQKLSISNEQTLLQYTTMNSKILNLIIKITKVTNIKKLSQNMVAYIDFLYFKENAGIERALGTNIILSKNATRKTINEFHTLLVKQNIYKDLFLNYANKDFINYYKKNFAGSFIVTVKKIRKTILSGNDIAISKLNVKIWFQNITKKINKLKIIDTKLTKNIIISMNKQLDGIENKVFLFILVGVFSIIIYILMVLIILKFAKEDDMHKKLISKYIITSTTDTKGIITDVSDAFVDISGYTREELIGQPHNMVRHADMNKEVFKELWSTIKSGKTWRGEIVNLAKDGSSYWVKATIEPIFGNNGQIISYMAVRQNITDKIKIATLNKTLEDKVQSEVEKNREKDKTMLQQSRLAQMGEMISMIAHQWRQPLAAISATSINLILKAKLDKLDNDSAIELGEKISEYSQHLSATIDDFRDFFKPNKNILDTNYKKLIDSVLSIIELSVVNKNIELKQKLQSEVILSTYPNEIKQVILNLIKNAEDILLEKEIEDPVITIETEENILRVRDNAGGVPQDIIEKVFNPYFSTKTKKDGTGLGLYMSKTIVEEHCLGSLRVYNDEFGAVFEMELPVKKD